MISEIIVFVYLPGELEAVPAGTLTLTQIGKELSSKFVYGSRYMQRSNAIELDPISLPFKSVPRNAGEEITPIAGLSVFGAFRDATPDAWGRRVIEKHLKAVNLPEIEYIKYSYDDRVGALDFRDSPTAPPRQHPFNRVLDLQYLLDCADKIECDEPVPDDMLQMFNYGASMGGARPKAVVEDNAGLWLAKFRARNDKFDYAKVESATLLLAKECGINIPEVRVQATGDANIFLIKRFDRHKLGASYTRTHFISALTLLGKDESESLGSSYTDILTAIMRYGPKENSPMKKELYRRMVFNILVGNDDDHLRNHGFIYQDGCYCLSPVYDIVPAPAIATERYQHLNVGQYGRLATLNNALSQCELFGLSKTQATVLIKEMQSIVSNWRTFFAEQGVSSKDIAVLEKAFHRAEILPLNT